MGWDEEAGDAFPDGLGNTADVVSHDRQAVGGSFEVNEAEALDTVFEVDARHREDVGAVVKIGEFLVGNVAKEADGEIGFSAAAARSWVS